MRSLFFAVSCFLLAACGGSAGSVDPAESRAPSTPTGAAEGSGPETSVPVDGGAPAPDVPGLALHVRATDAAFPHADGLAGQTPTMARVGIVGLVLSRGEDDPSPWVVFDRGTSFVDTPLDPGSDTRVAAVPASQLRPGVYTRAQVFVTHVAFRVASVMHVTGAAVPGVFDDVQALADGVVLGGAPRASGWYRYTFLAGGTTPAGTLEGTAAPLPRVDAGPFRLVVEGGRARYEWPVTVVVTPETRGKAVLTVNVHEDFRWRDQQAPGFAPKVFDTTPTSFEPVESFVGNAYTLTLE